MGFWLQGTGVVHAQVEEASRSSLSSIEKPCDEYSGFFDSQSTFENEEYRIGAFANSEGKGEWSFFVGLDGSKQPQDLGVNANLGGRVGIDWGGALLEDWGLGLHLGTSLVASTNAVQVFEALGASSERTQSFTSVGLFQRSSSGLLWAGGYDFLFQDSFDSSFLGQWRMMVGVDWNERHQIGVRAAISDRSDTVDFLGTAIPFRSINQGHLYWRHQWPSSGQTSFWVGLVNSHAESNAALGPRPRRTDDFVMGADILLPLTAKLAIYGETNLIMPPDSGAVDAYLGIAFFPGGSRRARQQLYSPVLPAASSTTFSVDAGW